MKHSFVVFILVSMIYSCTYLNEEELYPNNTCDTSNTTYNLDIKPIFQENCYSCHSSSVAYYGNLNLENFNHIQRVIDNGKLLRNIKHEQGGIPMPYGGTKLSDCKINKIDNWINQGIPNN